MSKRSLDKEKNDPSVLFANALPFFELRRLLQPYLEYESIALDDICKDLVSKQDTLPNEEVLLLLLQEYLRRAK